MNRYIDADAYAAELKTRQDACKEIMDAAKEDENWELYDRMGAKFSIFVEAKLTLDASVCHGDMLGRFYSKYCPHCGALLRGEHDEC